MTDERNNPGPEHSRYMLPEGDDPERVTVTVDMAGDWLDQRCDPDVNIRKVNSRKVEQYALDMIENRWETTGEPLIFDQTGRLINGQHRLRALRLASQYGVESIDFYVHANQPRAIFSVLDTGLSRTAPQMATGKYATHRASAVRYLLDGSVGKYSRGGTPSQILRAMSEWPELDILAAEAVQAHLRARIPASPHLAVLVQAQRTAHRDRIKPWLDGVITGYDLAPGDARGHLRTRFTELGSARLNAVSSKETTYNLIAKAWNSYAVGERITVLRYQDQEGTIKVIGTE